MLVTCTGVAAAWCPLHGDCTCPDPEDRRDHLDCPLHGSESNHPDASWAPDPLAVLRIAHFGPEEANP